MTGTTVGHYRILEQLGKGGMGEVYLAEDTKLGRRVALKVLPRDLASDDTWRQRFEREARAVAALNHPNIVTIHSVEEVDGVAFLTLELVEGQTLADLMPAGRAAARSPAHLRHPARRRRRRGAPARHHAPRPQAAQRDGHHRRPGQGARLRPREARRQTRTRRRRDDQAARELTGDGPDRRARSPTCRRSRPRAGRSIRGATCSRSASCSTRWRPASGRSRATRRCRCSRRSSRTRRRRSPT